MSERDERPVVPETTEDESAVGWGEPPEEEDPDDTLRFLDEEPPHHGT
jgi:hypothetical protein